jgi:hypothetical protein
MKYTRRSSAVLIGPLAAKTVSIVAVAPKFVEFEVPFSAGLSHTRRREFMKSVSPREGTQGQEKRRY